VPALWVLEQRTAAALDAFAMRGGHVVVTPRTGLKDTLNRLFPALAPGPLSALCGVEVEDSYPLAGDISVLSKKPGLKGKAKTWCERLRLNAKDAEVWASFGPESGWLEGKPAIVSRKAGKGRVTTLAGCFEPKLLDAAFKEIFAKAGLAKQAAPPAGVELARRPGKNGECLFVLNHGDKAARLTLPKGREVFSGKAVGGNALIPGRGAWLIEIKAK